MGWTRSTWFLARVRPTEPEPSLLSFPSLSIPCSSRPPVASIVAGRFRPAPTTSAAVLVRNREPLRRPSFSSTSIYFSSPGTPVRIQTLVRVPVAARRRRAPGLCCSAVAGVELLLRAAVVMGGARFSPGPPPVTTRALPRRPGVKDL